MCKTAPPLRTPHPHILSRPYFSIKPLRCLGPIGFLQQIVSSAIRTHMYTLSTGRPYRRRLFLLLFQLHEVHPMAQCLFKERVRGSENEARRHCHRSQCIAARQHITSQTSGPPMKTMSAGNSIDRSHGRKGCGPPTEQYRKMKHSTHHCPHECIP